MILTDYVKLGNSGDKLRSNVCPERRTDILTDHLVALTVTDSMLPRTPEVKVRKAMGPPLADCCKF